MIIKLWEKLPRNFLLNCFLFIVGIMLIFRPTADPDFGWHYRYGEYFYNTGTLLNTNIFSYVTYGEEWNSFYWLSQIFFYLFYTGVPFVLGGIILSAALSLFILSFLTKYKINNIGKVLMMLLIPYILGIYGVTSRPLLFSSVFLVILVYILIKKPQLRFFIPLLFVLWVNTHADWLFGLAIAGIYTAASIIAGIRQKPYKYKAILTNTSFGLLTLGATLINPYGIKLWTTLFNEALMANNGFISEWGAAWVGKDIGGIVFYVFLMTVTGCVIASIYFQRKKLQLWYVISMGLFFILASRAIYFFRIFILAAIPVLGTFWGEYILTMYKLIQKQEIKRALRVISALVLLITFLTIAESFFKKIVEASDISKWSAENKYPYEALKTIRQNPEEFTGNMLNTYEWGGFLIWQLPEHKTFIDGRMASWGINREPTLAYEYVQAGETSEDLLNVINKYDIGWVLVKAGSRIGKIIQENTINKFNIIEKNDIYILATVNN